MFISRGMKFTITVALRSTTRQTCRAPRRTCSWSFSVRLSLSLASTPCAPRSSWVRRQRGLRILETLMNSFYAQQTLCPWSHMALCMEPAIFRGTENLVSRELLLKDEQLTSCRHRSCCSFSSSSSSPSSFRSFSSSSILFVRRIEPSLI